MVLNLRLLLLLSLLLLLASACSVARPLTDEVDDDQLNHDKRELSKHRRELGNLKQLIEEMVRSGYADGGAAFRPGK